jgi:hypothetical protein
MVFFLPWISSIPNPLFLGLSLVIELQDSKELFKCRHLYLKQMAKTLPSKLAKTLLPMLPKPFILYVQTDCIARISLKDGAVLGWILLPNLRFFFNLLSLV